MPADPQSQHKLFVTAVDLLGGQRATAAALDVTERTVRDLVSGKRPMHTGFLRDISSHLLAHADACRSVERRLNPLYAENRTEAQAAERPDRRRFDMREDTREAQEQTP